MNFFEAISSGNMFARSSNPNFWYGPYKDQKQYLQFTLEEMLATDYFVKEPVQEVSLTRFWAAYDNAMNIEGQDTIGRVVDSMSYFIFGRGR